MESIWIRLLLLPCQVDAQNTVAPFWALRLLFREMLEKPVPSAHVSCSLLGRCFYPPPSFASGVVCTKITPFIVIEMNIHCVYVTKGLSKYSRIYTKCVGTLLPRAEPEYSECSRGW